MWNCHPFSSDRNIIDSPRLVSVLKRSPVDVFVFVCVIDIARWQLTSYPTLQRGLITLTGMSEAPPRQLIFVFVFVFVFPRVFFMQRGLITITGMSGAAACPSPSTYYSSIAQSLCLCLESAAAAEWITVSLGQVFTLMSIELLGNICQKSFEISLQQLPASVFNLPNNMLGPIV